MNDLVLQVGLILLDASIKGLAVLGLAWGAVSCAPRASAATRHLIWTIAASALLLLPVLSNVLPHWRIAVLPAREQPARSLPEVVPAIFIQPGKTAFSESALAAEVLPATVAPTPIQSPPWAMHHWIALGLCAWLVGAALVMVPWLVSAMVMRRVGRRARCAPPGALRATFDRLCDELSIGRRVVLLLDRQSTMPITWGLLRPRILQPDDAASWPAAQLRSVLLHELAHVRRLDCVTQLVAQLACAIYWFNPLSWVMVWRMRGERERACDDVVLARGQGAAAYAEQLVEVARLMKCAPLSRAAAIAMARPSQLRTRVLAILDGKVNRNRVTHGAALGCLVVTAIVLIPLAMLRAAEPQATQPAKLSQTILLVTEGNFFLERALQSTDIPCDTFTPADYERRGAGEHGLVVFDRYAPAKLPQTACLLVGVVPVEGPIRQKPDVINDVVVTDWKADHPILEDLSLSRVIVADMRALEVPADAVILVSGKPGPLIVISERDGRRVMVIGFDIMHSNWPPRVSFPVFVHRAARYLLTGAIEDSPATRPVSDARAQLANHRAELEAQIYQLRKQNPTIDFRDVRFEELAEVSRELTKSQLALIEAKATFAETHPSVKQAVERRQELQSLYEQKLEEAAKLNGKAAEYQKLVDELDRVKAEEARLRARAVSSSGLAQTLEGAHANVIQRLKAAEEAMFEFQKKHPTVNFDTIYQQELAELSRAYTQAQLKSIEARGIYAENHPNSVQLRKNEEQFYALYQDKLQQVMKLNAAAADYQKLAAELTQLKEFEKQLAQRLREITTQPASRPVGGAPGPDVAALRIAQIETIHLKERKTNRFGDMQDPRNVQHINREAWIDAQHGYLRERMIDDVRRADGTLTNDCERYRDDELITAIFHNLRKVLRSRSRDNPPSANPLQLLDIGAADLRTYQKTGQEKVNDKLCDIWQGRAPHPHNAEYDIKLWVSEGGIIWRLRSQPADPAKSWMATREVEVLEVNTPMDKNFFRAPEHADYIMEPIREGINR